MFIFLSIMAFGAVIGYQFRKYDPIHKVSKLIHLIICLLLFLLGISVGLNKMIIENISYFCGQAAVISSLSILGSMLVSMLLYHFCFKEKGYHEE